MSDPQITPELVEKHNLTKDEYAKILSILGREPTYTELGVFSVMWSEHCSYKNTRPLLKTLPTKSPRILVGAGEENAGIVDIGGGLAIAFKIESHNHPSAVEPFQGAATGVGGIIRDIFTMGARPVCSVDSLRFGPIGPEEAGPGPANNRRLFAGVVSGIAHYGNCFGIPTIAGEVYFDKSYEGNPLVNAFCLGVLRHEQIARGAAKGAGNPVFYVGPPTGRDGLAGAAFASRDLTEESSGQQRGAVQVGDPFMEKLVCEACLELLATDAVAGIQDMGAAGLTCSTCETAARAGTGIEIELALVPQRVPGMTPYEIMLSESQERMLIIVRAGREAEVKRIFDKWDLPSARIGQVTDTGRMIVKHYLQAVRAFSVLPPAGDPVQELRRLLAWPTIASKNWVYRQYDHMVRDGSALCPGSDAAVIRIKADSLPETGDAAVGEKYLALSVDCNGTYVYLDPYEGAKIAVAEAARNLACSGATPLGATDNLNFANPHNPELFWQLQESVRGLADACRALDAPITGGNCSLYNHPTPTVALVGLIEKPEHITTQWFKDEGDAIILLGEPMDLADPLRGMGGSAWLQCLHGLKTGTPPRCDLEGERRLHTTLRGLIYCGLIRSAHDCSEGGLAVALAESCISRQIARDTPRLIGAQVDLTFALAKDTRIDALLFGESQGRIVISVAPADVVKVVERSKIMGVSAVRIGTVGGVELAVKLGAVEAKWPVSDLHDLWWNAIARAMSA